jgi:hypothetical protein
MLRQKILLWIKLETASTEEEVAHVIKAKRQLRLEDSKIRAPKQDYPATGALMESFLITLARHQPNHSAKTRVERRSAETFCLPSSESEVLAHPAFTSPGSEFFNSKKRPANDSFEESASTSFERQEIRKAS